MNPLNINHIKFEKAILIKLRLQKLRKTINLFRVFEIFLVIAVITRIFFQLPLTLAFKFSHKCLHSLYLILLSPQFVFILGNAIVITLFINSGHFNTPCKVKTPKTTPTYELLKKNTKSQPKKQGKTEGNNQVVKICHRSKSEKLRREKLEKGFCELRRSNSENKSLKSCDSSRCCKESGEGHYPEDHVSNEEFRKIIENFIAKQQRFLRQQEECQVVGSNF